MKKTTLAVLCLFALATLSFGQTTITLTTLANAMTSGATTISLASSTGVTAAGITPITGLYVDNDYMTVGDNVSGNIWNVKHVAGVVSAHLSGAPVAVGPPGAFDQGTKDPTGSCVSTSLVYLPRINVRTGNVSNCTGAAGQWANFGSFASKVFGSTLITSLTLVPTSPFHAISIASSGTATTITPPASFLGGNGCVTFVPLNTSYLSTSGNLSLATTLIVGKHLTACYNATTALWSSSY